MKKQRSKVLEEGGKGERSNYIISKTIIKGKYVNIFFSFYISINICCYLFFFILEKVFLCICMCVCVCVCVCLCVSLCALYMGGVYITMGLWRPNDNFTKLLLFFNLYICFRNLTLTSTFPIWPLPI